MATKIPIDTQELAVNIFRQVDGMRKDKKHCDFLIKVGSEEIPAHRNILSASSDYFDAMYSHPTKENKSGVVEMIGVDPECAIICVDHMYGKEVSILPDKYEPLMYVATLMQLLKLRNAIVSLVEANLDPKSFFSARRIANIYGCKPLEKMCKEYAEKNFRLISKEEEFGELDKNYIKKMIKSRNVRISEEQKLIGLLRWIKYNARNKEFLMELLKGVNLSNVPVEFRRYMVEKEPLISQSQEAFKIISLSIMDSMKVGIRNVQDQSESEETHGSESVIVIFDINSGHLQHFNPRRNTWKEMQKMNDDMMKNNFSAVSFGDHIYVLMQKKSLYRLKYSDETSTWEKMADMIESHGRPPPAVVIGDSIFVVGAFSREKTRSVERYDASANQWTKLFERPVSCQYSTVLASQGSIYKFGGFIGLTANYTGEVERFSLSSQNWMKMASMAEEKSYVAAVELNNMIYILGGRNSGHRHTTARYEPALNQWTTLKSMLVAGSWFRGFAIDGHIYAVGGYNSSPDSIEKYDIEKNEWKLVRMPSGMKLNIVESTKIDIYH